MCKSDNNIIYIFERRTHWTAISLYHTCRKWPRYRNSRRISWSKVNSFAQNYRRMAVQTNWALSGKLALYIDACREYDPVSSHQWLSRSMVHSTALLYQMLLWLEFIYFSVRIRLISLFTKFSNCFWWVTLPDLESLAWCFKFTCILFTQSPKRIYYEQNFAFYKDHCRLYSFRHRYEIFLRQIRFGRRLKNKLKVIGHCSSTLATTTPDTASQSNHAELPWQTSAG